MQAFILPDWWIFTYLHPHARYIVSPIWNYTGKSPYSFNIMSPPTLPIFRHFLLP